MAELSRYAARRLAQARRICFGRPVTAYITNAQIIARAGFGVMHDHIKADAWGRFSDGHRVRTSDVMRTERIDGFYVLHTRYSVVGFDFPYRVVLTWSVPARFPSGSAQPSGFIYQNC